MKSKNKLCLIMTLLIANTPSFADGFSWLQIDGKLRAYDFMRDFNKSGVNDQQAFALGGELNFLTAFKSDWQIGGSFYTSQTLGLNGGNPKSVENSLPGHTVSVIGQTFLQYHTKKWLARLGNQEINTPWINSADSRMIPATYEGAYIQSKITDDLSISALRIYRYKSRIADNFTRSNLYNTANGSSLSGFGNTPNQGALAFNSSYKKNVVEVNAWYYRFYDFANLLYGDSKYQFVISENMRPYIGLQALREWGDGKNLLMPYVPGSANATGIGALLGAKVNKFDIALGYNSLFKNQAAFRSGDVISPYTSGYASDPLYTTSMGAGLVEKAAGQAYKMSLKYYALSDALTIGGSYAKYFTAPLLTNTNEADLDTTYKFSNSLTGLSARYRFGILNGNQSTGRVVYNRIMLQYAF